MRATFAVVLGLASCSRDSAEGNVMPDGSDRSVEGDQGAGPAPTCGEGICGDACCSAADTECTCPADCLDACGDGCCCGAEDDCSCQADCPVVLGDGCCSPGEDPCDEPAACSGCCGDGACEPGEDAVSC